jgi:mono/diheme cytochrome c family protein
MSNFDPEAYDRRTKILLLGVSVATLVFLIVAAVIENVYPEWRGYRSEYALILMEKSADGDLGGFQVSQIEQNFVPALAVTDRCITCHTGVQDPRMLGEPHPFAAHPGEFLAQHPPEQFGCTICHEGQGLATDSRAAHGHTEDWLYPLHESNFVYSSCAQCHDADLVYAEIKDENDAGHGGGLVAQGKRLVETRGCMGCHIIDGIGGTLGPDISFVGDKTKHDFDFSHVESEEHTVAAWLERHFLEPDEISPGTTMPDLNLVAEDATALTAYTLSLRRKDIPFGYAVKRPVDLAPPAPPGGKELFGKFCSACHGQDGRESEVPGIRTPALNNPDTLAVASDDFMRHIIDHGRSGTLMPAWGPDSASLSLAEIDRIVEYIRGWEAQGAELAKVDVSRGDVTYGRAYYQGLCANCHGGNGEGGIGNALSSPTFLGVVSDTFLAETIIQGRPGTAMASWKHLSAQSVSDLLAYIRSWQPEPPEFSEVQRSLYRYSREDNRRYGEAIYRGNCLGCHGESGVGGIGLRLNSPNIVPAVSNKFLYRTIVEGRTSTAMPAWPQLSADEIAGLITYLRSWQDAAPVALASAPGRANYDLGRIHFELACAQCHGDRGQGGVGPQLVNSTLLDTASNDLLYEWIAHGRVGTAMKGFLPEEQGVVELESDEIADVIAWLRYEDGAGEKEIMRTGVGNASLGSELYMGNCASCHGAYGEGASGPQLHNPTFLRTASDGFLAATMVMGRQGTAMHPMTRANQGLGQLAPNEVQDVVAFMRLWDYDETWKMSRPSVEVNARSIHSGGEKFGRFCAGCHGTNGKGVADGDGFFAPALNNPEFLAAASDGYLLATIARGRSETPMRPFGKGAGGISDLDAEAIGDIVSYIRSWQEPTLVKGD